MQLNGFVQAGVGNAAYWLEKNADAYCLWTGMKLVPGSLNVQLPSKFDLSSPDIAPFKRVHSLVPFGGNRDICLVPCEIFADESNRIYAFAWATTFAANEADYHVLEIVSDIHLRTALGLQDGMKVSIEIPLPWKV